MIEEITMIGTGVPSEGTSAPVYADSTIKTKEEMKALDAKATDPESFGPPLSPRQQLMVQVWQSLNFCASNAMLEASDRDHAEDIELAYKIMDMCNAQINAVYKRLEDERKGV